MSVIWIIAVRELRSFFRVPMGWVVLALYLFMVGIVVGFLVIPDAGRSSAATLQPFFSMSLWLVLFLLAPAISMRLVSEELRSGTFEPLMTSPASDGSIIVGKFLGGLFFVLVLLAPTLVYAVLLYLLSDPRPDFGPIAAGYLSLVLAASTSLSIGLVVSTLTSNQTLAFIGTFLFLLLTQVLSFGLIDLPRPVAFAAGFFAFLPRISVFSKGVIDTGHVAFFLSVAAWFLVVAYVSLQMRRWR